VVGREGKVSVVAEGSVRDWVVRCESKPIIGVAVVIVVVVIRETSVRRNKVVVVTEDDMVVIGVIVFTGLVLEAFGGFGFGGSEVMVVNCNDDAWSNRYWYILFSQPIIFNSNSTKFQKKYIINILKFRLKNHFSSQNFYANNSAS
jgi:hypothetical protein